MLGVKGVGTFGSLTKFLDAIQSKNKIKELDAIILAVLVNFDLWRDDQYII